jgi:glycosyltransferase involved in cell wall biosynthesis
MARPRDSGEFVSAARVGQWPLEFLTMNILLINHYAGSPAHGMEYRPYYLSREWLRAGHTTTVVAASFSHLRNRAVICPHPVTEEAVDGIRYVWLKCPAYAGNGLGRVRNMATFVAGLYRHRRRIVGTVPPDVVIASSTYPLDIWPAATIARASGARLVFEVHDLWPLSPMVMSGIPRWHPFTVVMQLAEDYACRRADRVVSMLPKANEHLQERGMPSDRFSYVPNGIVVSEWDAATAELPAQHSAKLAELRKAGFFVVGYAGGHGLSNALDSFLEAGRLLKGEPVALLLVGQGPEKEAVERRATECGLTHVHFLPPVPKASIPSLLSQMDSLYIGWRRSPLYRFGVSPNKLMDYMMSGRPVIHAIEAANDAVKDSGCGISVAPEDPGAIAEAVRTLVRMTADERADLGARGRRFVVQHYDYRVLAGKFIDAISTPPRGAR